MQFKKINEKAFKCIISQEEMDEQGVQLDDLMDNRDKAETFLRYILQQAKYEVDFESTGEALNIQMTVMPCGDIQLMISDDKNSAIRGMLSELRNHLKDFHGTLEEKKKELEEIKAKAVDVSTDEKDAEEIIKMDLWAEIASLENAMRLAKALPQLLNHESSLYKMNDKYYLVVDIEMTRKELAGIAFTVAEYSDTLYADNPGTMQIAEHGKLITEGNALAVLAQL